MIGETVGVERCERKELSTLKKKIEGFDKDHRQDAKSRKTILTGEQIRIKIRQLHGRQEEVGRYISQSRRNHKGLKELKTEGIKEYSNYGRWLRDNW